MQGTIFSIEEFSVYDGPGIRSTVFLKGCPLRCTWCHNPEGQNEFPEIVKSPNGCLNCGNCEKAAEKRYGKKIFTEKSIVDCPQKLLRVCGERIDAEELVQRIVKNENILKPYGGVTFSGGEPLAQCDFLCECINLLNGRLHTAVQTSGYALEKDFLRVLDCADYFLFDLKLSNGERHKKYTGVQNLTILNNFSELVKSGKDFVVRIPLIPSITDTEENISGICEILNKNNVKYAELLPYNKMAGGKYAMLGRRYIPGFDEKDEVSSRKNIFKMYGIKIKIL